MRPPLRSRSPPQAPASAQFSNGYFFGDSLTDTGSFKPVLPGTGLFTTNPGPIWATNFAQHFGFTATPANQGGTNYAQGGSNVTATPGYPPIFPIVAAVPVTAQITQFLAKGPLDTNAIYTIWAGGNDINAELDKVLAGQESQAQALANLNNVAKDLVAQIARLNAAGARYILVVDVPDVGKSPDAIDSGQAAAITSVVQTFNQSVAAGLNGLGIQAIRLNTFSLVNEIAASPAVYGFSNSTQRACGAIPALICTPANLVTPDAAQTYMFADGHHPSTALHAILAQYAESVIEAPQQMAVLAEAPLAVEQANWRTLDGRMVSAVNGPRSPGNFEAWAAYDYSAPDYSSSFFNGNGDVNTISVGADMKVSSRLLVGLMFNYSENKADYSGMGFKLKEPMGTLYAGYGDGPWYLGATLGGGSLEYDTTRNITLGAATRTETGTANGWQFVARLLGGYWFKAGDWIHGPTVRLTYQEIRVHQFSENGIELDDDDVRPAGADLVRDQRGLAGVRPDRISPSVRARHMGVRGPGRRPRRDRERLWHGRQLQPPGVQARQQLGPVQSWSRHRFRQGDRLHHRIGDRRQGRRRLLCGDGRRPRPAVSQVGPRALRGARANAAS